MNRDDAAGGRRGLRATPSPELLEAVRDCYGVDSGNGIVDLGGSSSLNLLVRDEGRRYVVRVYRPYVTEARLDDIRLARRELAARLSSIGGSVAFLDDEESARRHAAGTSWEVEWVLGIARELDRSQTAFA